MQQYGLGGVSANADAKKKWDKSSCDLNFEFDRRHCMTRPIERGILPDFGRRRILVQRSCHLLSWTIGDTAFATATAALIPLSRLRQLLLLSMGGRSTHFRTPSNGVPQRHKQ